MPLKKVRMSFEPEDLLFGSAEAIVVKPKYRELFTADDVQFAEEKLKWLKSFFHPSLQVF